MPPAVRRRIRTKRLVLVLTIAVGFLVGVLLVLGSVLRRGRGASTAALPTPTSIATPLPFSERDTDRDGLTDAREIALGTDLAKPDTDGDGRTDAEELTAGFNPLGPGLLDRDADGLPDRDEERIGSDTTNADTDGDGYLDGDEVRNCYNPRTPSPGDKVAGCPPFPKLAPESSESQRAR